MSDLISVIVPVYNASKYLDQCIESILTQTYKKLEIILIDDGSTDSSREICMNYRKRDTRIHFISQKNGGSVAARKAGIEAANGKFIGFVDSDDYIEPNMFENLYSKIKEFNVDFVHSGMILDQIRICTYDEMVVDFSVWDRAKFINENIFQTYKMIYALWSKLFKANIIKDVFSKLPDEQNYGEDLLCLCRYISKCNRFYMYKDAFYHYRIHDISLSHLNWTDTCIQESNLYSNVIKILEENKLLEECRNSVEEHYRRRLMMAIMKGSSSDNNVFRYKFDNINILEDKRIALYGAGKVGRDFFYQLSQNKQCKIVAWADKQKYGLSNLISICRPEELKKIEFDILLLAIKNKFIADEVRTELIENNICNDNTCILWKEPVCLW